MSLEIKHIEGDKGSYDYSKIRSKISRSTINGLEEENKKLKRRFRNRLREAFEKFWKENSSCIDDIEYRGVSHLEVWLMKNGYKIVRNNENKK